MERATFIRSETAQEYVDALENLNMKAKVQKSVVRGCMKGYQVVFFRDGKPCFITENIVEKMNA